MLNAAMIGLGNWGQVLISSVQGRSEHIRFVAGATATKSAECTAAFAAVHGIEVLPDLDAVLARDDIEAVVIATPHSQHCAQIVAAASAGRHVFCEKPLTLTLEDARAAYRAAEASSVILAPGHNRRFLPAYRKLQHIVTSGILGDIRQVSGNFSWGQISYPSGSWRYSLSESPAGGMTSRGIHVIDAMIGLGLYAEAVVVAARAVSDQSTHTLTAMIDHADGSLGILTTINGPGKLWRLEVFGSRGRASMESETRITLVCPNEPEQIWDFGSFDTERAELEAFAHAIRGGDQWPVSQDQALAGIALLEAIFQGAENTGQRIELQDVACRHKAEKPRKR